MAVVSGRAITLSCFSHQDTSRDTKQECMYIPTFGCLFWPPLPPPISPHQHPPTAECIKRPVFNLLIMGQEHLALRWRAEMGGKIPEAVAAQMPDLRNHGAAALDGFGARFVRDCLSSFVI